MNSATPWGVEAREVQVEVAAYFGLPAMQLIGLPDTAVRESRDRVRAAIRSSGYDLQSRNVVINLAPADLRKEGNQLDLPIALGLLTANRELTAESLEGRMACGELGLDGEVRPVRGALSITELAGRLGIREVLLPAANSRQAASIGGTRVIPVAHLREAIEHLTGDRVLTPATAMPPPAEHGRHGARLLGCPRPGNGQAGPGDRRGPAGTTSSSSGRREPARRCSPGACPASCRRSPARRRSR